MALVLIFSFLGLLGGIPNGKLNVISVSAGATITVDDDGGQDYTAIQTAIDNAADGDTIEVYPGEYAGDLVITGKTLTIIGYGTDKSVINGTGKGIGLKLASSGNSVTGFTVKNGDVGILVDGVDDGLISDCNCTDNNYAGIAINGSSGSVVDNVSCINNRYGISINDSQAGGVSNSTCSSNSESGINITLSTGFHLDNDTCHSNKVGIFLGEAHQSAVLDCNVQSNSESGVRFHTAHNNTVERCVLAKHGAQGQIIGTGFHGSYSNDNVVSSCNITGNWRFGGEFDHGSLRNRISRNVVTANTQGVGLLLMKDCANNMMDNNSVTGNFQGMYIWLGTHNTVEYNSVNTSTNYGLILYIGADSNHVKYNRLGPNPAGGLLMYDADSNLAENNTCNDNANAGIRISLNAKTNIVRKNLIMNNTMGISIDDPGCKNNVIYANHLIKNNGTGGIQGEDLGQENVWDDGSHGNFWSDYRNRRYNASHDGDVWNLSYEMKGGNGRDRFPFGRLPITELDTEDPVFLADNTSGEATTGDRFNFSLNVTDDVGFRTVTLFYQYDNSEVLYMLPMKYYSDDNWFRNIIVNESARNITYRFLIEDYLGKGQNIGDFDIPVRDNDPPTIIDRSAENASTGEDFEVLADVTDNREVDFISVLYSYDGTVFENSSMDLVEDSTWNWTLEVNDSANWFDYYISSGDASGNVNDTPVRRVLVKDNDMPSFMQDLTAAYATTGDQFHIEANISDNVQLHAVSVNFTFDGKTWDSASSSSGDENLWSCAVDVPDNASNMSYNFFIEDAAGNRLSTSRRTIDVRDNDRPVLLGDGSAKEATTGDDFTFAANLTDNIGIHEGWVVYTYDGSELFNVSMELLDTDAGVFYFGYTLTLPTDATLFEYHYHFLDAAGNHNHTSPMLVYVFDNDAPLADAGNDTEIDQYASLSFNGSGSTDNIGVDEYEWTLDYGGSETLRTGVDPVFQFNLAGVFEVVLNVTDAAGNWQNDTVIITVRDRENPKAVAGKDVLGEPGDTIHLDGSASSDNIGIVKYQWHYSYNDSEVILPGASLNYTFDIPGSYTVTLNVTDEAGNWALDTITVLITLDDTIKPIARAGDDVSIEAGDTVYFDGTGSTDNIGLDNFTWNFTYNGSAIELYGPSPFFTFENEGEYSVKLTVFDLVGKSDIDKMTVEVKKNGTGGTSDDDDTPGGGDPGGIDGEKGSQTLLIILGLIALVVVAIIVIVFVVVLRKRRKNEPEDVVTDTEEGGEALIPLPPERVQTAAGTPPVVSESLQSQPLSSLEVAPAGIAAPMATQIPQVETPVGAAPVCAGCGLPSLYYPDYECFWCDKCQEYVYPTSEATSPEALPGPQGTESEGVKALPQDTSAAETTMETPELAGAAPDVSELDLDDDTLEEVGGDAPDGITRGENAPETHTAVSTEEVESPARAEPAAEGPVEGETAAEGMDASGGEETATPISSEEEGEVTGSEGNASLDGPAAVSEDPPRIDKNLISASTTPKEAVDPGSADTDNVETSGKEPASESGSVESAEATGQEGSEKTEAGSEPEPAASSSGNGEGNGTGKEEDLDDMLDDLLEGL